MSHRIYASFPGRDQAEQAAARLRRKGVPFRFAVENMPGGGFQGARASMDLLFPTRFPNNLTGFSGMAGPYELGRASLGADVFGLPFYAGQRETRACFTVDDEHYDEVRALLYNCGGYDLR